MKANTLRTIIGLFISGLIISSCSLVKDFDYTVTPNPLEMHGDSVKFTVVVNIPEKGIKKTVKALTLNVNPDKIKNWLYNLATGQIEQSNQSKS